MAFFQSQEFIVYSSWFVVKNHEGAKESAVAKAMARQGAPYIGEVLRICVEKRRFSGGVKTVSLFCKRG